MLQHWGYTRTVDMSPFEGEGQYFEVGAQAALPVVAAGSGCADVNITTPPYTRPPTPPSNRPTPPTPTPLTHPPSQLQGTGVLVIDRINGVAYVALSERADKALAEVRGWVGEVGGGVRAVCW